MTTADPVARLAAAARALLQHLRDPEMDAIAVVAGVHGVGYSKPFAARGEAIVAELEAALAALEVPTRGA